MVGVRPDRLSLVTPGTSDSAIHGKLLVDEFQGDRSILTVVTDGGMIKCVAAADVNLTPGEHVALETDRDHLVFFDPQTTDALFAKAMSARRSQAVA